jgi:hypothetical protein
MLLGIYVHGRSLAVLLLLLPLIYLEAPFVAMLLLLLLLEQLLQILHLLLQLLVLHLQLRRTASTRWGMHAALGACSLVRGSCHDCCCCCWLLRTKLAVGQVILGGFKCSKLLLSVDPHLCCRVWHLG